MIRALLLDFDGTLADSLPALRRVYERFVGQLGGQASIVEFDSLNGPPLREVVRRLCATHQRRDLTDEDFERYERLVAEELLSIAPAAEADVLLDAAAARGIRCAVVTSNKADLVSAWLDANNLSGRCEVIVSGEEVSEGKPSPEPYRLALRKLGLTPDEALAIEDSRSGVRSASAAGIRTLWLTHANEPEFLCIGNLGAAVPHFVETGA